MGALNLKIFFFKLAALDIWLMLTWGSRFKGHWVPVLKRQMILSIMMKHCIMNGLYLCISRRSTLLDVHVTGNCKHCQFDTLCLNWYISLSVAFDSKPLVPFWAMKLLEDTQLLHGIKIKEPFLQLTWQTVGQVVSLNVTWDLPSRCHPGNQSQAPEKWLCQKVSVVSKFFFSIASCQSSKKQHLQSSKISNLQNLSNRNSRYKSEISRTNKWTNLSF